LQGFKLQQVGSVLDGNRGSSLDGNQQVTNYKDAEMALRWTAAGFLEAEKSFKKLRGHADLKTLINGLRPAIQQLRKAA
jgi:putative transposase